MKKCHVCGEEFHNEFSFCPVDGTPFGIRPWSEQCDSSDSAAAEFHLTLIGEEALARRLGHQLSFVADQIQQAWPSFKNDPIAFAARRVAEGKRVFKRTLARPHVFSGAASALLIVAAIVLSVMVLERHARKADSADLINNSAETLLTVEIDLRNETKPN